MYVCINVCMYVCMYIYIYIHIYVCIGVYNVYSYNSDQESLSQNSEITALRNQKVRLENPPPLCKTLLDSNSEFRDS